METHKIANVFFKRIYLHLTKSFKTCKEIGKIKPGCSRSLKHKVGRQETGDPKEEGHGKSSVSLNVVQFALKAKLKVKEDKANDSLEDECDKVNAF